MVWSGSWISGFFIIVTDAWMQHPVAYDYVNGHYEVASFWQYAVAEPAGTVAVHVQHDRRDSDWVAL